MMLKKILILCLLAFFYCNGVSAKEAVNMFTYSRPMPKRAIYDENGHKVNFADFKGDFVLLNIWSRYCIPCIKELKSLNGFVKKNRDPHIRLVMLSPSEEWHTPYEQRQFLRKYKASDLTFYTDKQGKLAEDLGVFSSPHVVLINTKGEEIGRIRGSADWDDNDVIEYIYKLKERYGY